MTGSERVLSKSRKRSVPMKKIATKMTNKYNSFTSYEELLKWIHEGKGTRHAEYSSNCTELELVMTKGAEWNDDGFMIRDVDFDEYSTLDGWINPDGTVDEEMLKDEFDLTAFVGVEVVDVEVKD